MATMKSDYLTPLQSPVVSPLIWHSHETRNFHKIRSLGGGPVTMFCMGPPVCSYATNLQGSLVWQNDRTTDCPTRSVTIGHMYYVVLWCGCSSASYDSFWMHNKNRQTIGYADNLSVHGSMQANVFWALETQICPQFYKILFCNYNLLQ